MYLEKDLEAHHQRNPSLEHYCYLVVPGKIDRKIYQSLLYAGVSEGNWVVRADIEDLTKLHSGNQKFTLGCLNRLRILKLLVAVCKTRQGWLFLIPALKTFVVEPNERNSAGRASLKSKKAKRVLAVHNFIIQ
jgi:hypothetical protein